MTVSKKKMYREYKELTQEVINLIKYMDETT